MSITQRDIIYFILTDRFYGVSNNNPEVQKDTDTANPYYYHGGNFDGIIAKIPYLKKLGITALWITPVYLQSQLPEHKAYHGYWTLDFNCIDPHLYIDKKKHPAGSKLYLKDLTDELHANGIKLILDMVVNHTGYNHPGETNAPENPTPIRPHWFNQKGLDSSQNLIKGALASLPDMDLDNVDVADYHIRTIISWIRETGIDAIRMDTVKHVEKIFWNNYKTQVRGLYPDVSLLGEVLEYDIDRVSEYQRHLAFDNLFDFPLQDAMKKVFVDGHGLDVFFSPFNQGLGILEKDGHYNNHNKLSTLLDNHDLWARFFSMCHDTFQDRTASFQVLRLALIFLFTIRGIPQIYYGTEIGLDGHSDPDNRKDFPWRIFDSENNVRPEYVEEKKTFDLTCSLVALRKQEDAFSCGEMVCLYVDYFVLVYLKYIMDSVVIVSVHNGWSDMPVGVEVRTSDQPRLPTPIRNLLKSARFVDALTGEKVSLQDGSFQVQLPGKSARVLVMR